MAGGVNIGLRLSTSLDVVSDLTQSKPTVISGASAAYVKGAWSQLIASTTIDTSWVIVQCDVNSGFGNGLAFDIGVGASGSEIALVQNLVTQMQIANETTFMFPLAIKSGSRVSARLASNQAFDSGGIKLTCFDDSTLSCGAGSEVDTYGFNSSTNLGTTVDAGGTANTKGAYAQITSSVTNDLAGFFIIFDQQDLTTGTAGTVFMLLDIAIGASGAEKVILPNFSVMVNYAGGACYHLPETMPYIPIPIKAGTRVAARSQANTNTSPDRTVGVTFYGVRL